MELLTKMCIRDRDARLDSLVENRTSISYYYSQEVPTEETFRKMLITLRGRVEMCIRDRRSVQQLRTYTIKWQEEYATLPMSAVMTVAIAPDKEIGRAHV